MPAPDFQTIFDVETAMKNAVDTILSAAPYNFSIVRSQAEQGKRVYPRADAQFDLGAEETHRGEFSPGQFINDAWLGVLTVTIGTKRGDGSHGQMRGLARLAMQYFKDEFNSSRLPYHVLTRIKHGNTECGISADNDTDLSAINFECVVSVRPGAWPITSTPVTWARADILFSNSSITFATTDA